MKARDINLAILETQIKKFECARCDKSATIVKYGCAFCGDYCAEAAGEYTLDDGEQRVPDYTEDLNAMHEAEKIFEDCEIKWARYIDILKAIVEPHRHYMHATALQKAEAYLHFFDKWPTT